MRPKTEDLLRVLSRYVDEELLYSFAFILNPYTPRRALCWGDTSDEAPVLVQRHRQIATSHPPVCLLGMTSKLCMTISWGRPTAGFLRMHDWATEPETWPVRCCGSPEQASKHVGVLKFLWGATHTPPAIDASE